MYAGSIEAALRSNLDYLHTIVGTCFLSKQPVPDTETVSFKYHMLK